MRFMRLTLLGGFASLRSESRQKGYLGLGMGLPNPSVRRIDGLMLTMLGVAAALAGCASIGATSPAEQKQKVVAERAQARWDLLIKGDIGSAYQFLSAASKATTSVDLYKAKTKPGMWHQAKVGTIECEAEVCKVTMMITYDAKQMKGIETPVPETWIIENGSAWYVYR
jgi:hypothetical protein